MGIRKTKPVALIMFEFDVYFATLPRILKNYFSKNKPAIKKPDTKSDK